MTLLKVRQLAKHFDQGDLHVPVLHGINFSLVAGESVAIVGPSGAGKSTFLHLLGGLEIPSSGEIIWNDIPLATYNSDSLAKFRSEQVGFVFQQSYLLGLMTVLENVMMPLLIKKEAKESARKKATKMLAEVGLNHRLDHYPNTLSGGEQQRVALARALVGGPKVLLADEPTGNLDSENSQRISDLMLGICANNNMALILVTHNMQLALRLGKRYQMQDGLLKSYD